MNANRRAAGEKERSKARVVAIRKHSARSLAPLERVDYDEQLASSVRHRRPFAIVDRGARFENIESVVEEISNVFLALFYLLSG